MLIYKYRMKYYLLIRNIYNSMLRENFEPIDINSKLDSKFDILSDVPEILYHGSLEVLIYY